MPTHPRPAGRLRPSTYAGGFCEMPGCHSRRGVYYDQETHKHMCFECWLSRPSAYAAVLIPKAAAPPAMIFLDRYTAAVTRLNRR